jgi:hypothetical protein
VEKLKAVHSPNLRRLESVPQRRKLGVRTLARADDRCVERIDLGRAELDRLL